MSYRETEIKLLVPDLAEVERRLLEVGGQLKKGRVFERNIRFDNARRTFTAQGIVLRLREDDRIRLTYKDGGTVMKDAIISRFEAEVEVSDFATMQLILERLGFVPIMAYEKYRITYTLDATEVVLDEMPFGRFVEIEGTAEAIQAALVRLGLEAMPRLAASYARLFERVKRYLGLEMRDLTFENFRDIDVPIEAFAPEKL